MTGPAASILVVDDSQSKRYVISSWLRRSGYLLTEAETGAEALRRMADTPIDLVVLDVRLPDMSGFAVCEQIKGNPAHAATPVIHVSAAAIEMVDRTQGLARGADAYLVEPIDPEELLATVHAILRYYRGRQHAERLAARLSVLAGLSLTFNSAKTPGELLAAAASGASTIFSSAAVVCAEDPDGGWLAATSTGPGALAAVGPWAEHARPGDQSRAGGLLPTSGSYADVADVAALHLGPVDGWPGPGACAAAASARPDHDPVYVLVPAGATDLSVLQLLAQAVAAAMETMRAYHIEHDLALTLQQSLLPRRLPRVAGVDLAKRYVPASETAEIGGDFYELSELDGQLLVAIGDVGGHSVHAATIMAELRHATRAYVAEGHGPAAVLDRLDQLMRTFIPGEIATMCLLMLDPATGRAQLANAGHPAPLLVLGDQVSQFSPHGSLLGLRSPAAIEHPILLPPGSTLVLYTDGLIERRGEHIDDSVARLVAAAGNPDPDLDAYCDRLLRQVGPVEPSDDIAVVAVRRHGRS